MSCLYLVSTPIGNLKDISLRSLEVLARVEAIICEDTRRTAKLLQAYEEYFTAGRPKLLSYTDHNRHQRIPQVVSILLKGGDAALVSDAGTPILSDPGYKLIQAVLEVSSSGGEVAVTSIPGANSLLPALQLSGLPPDRFFFAGFVPRKTAGRKKFYCHLPPTTVVVFESPYRLRKSLADLLKVRGDVPVAVCRELTKLHEEVLRGGVDEVLQKLSEGKVRGEVTLVIDLHGTTASDCSKD